MHDLPSITLLQQAHAIPKTGEELEVLGKQAACKYDSGESCTLNCAVVETVKHAGLSPEQVKRVVEFTNQSAYRNEFNKLGSGHKYIEFEGGPANPGEVLKDLNDGGGGTVFDRGVLDYASQPALPAKTASALLEQNRKRVGIEKTAQLTEADLAMAMGMPRSGSYQGWDGNMANNPYAQNRQKLMQVAMLQAATGRAPVVVKHAAAAELDFDPTETAFKEMFESDGPSTEPYAEPMQDSLDMREKLAGARDHLTGELGGLELAFNDILNDMYGEVKQAALQGMPLGQVVHAWADTVPGPDYVKTAFAYISPRLQEEEVFESMDAIGASLEKTAANGMVNHEHPLVQAMAAYVTVLDKLAHVRAARDVLDREFNRINWFVKKAAPIAGLTRVAQSGGLIPKVTSAARRAGEIIGPGVQEVGEAFLGAGSPVAAGVGKTVGGAVKYSPHAAGALGAHEAYQKAKFSPTLHRLAPYVPFSRASQARVAGGYY